MPVKVRCDSCGKVLHAPDQARGKAVRCPGCKNPIRVPAAAAKKKVAPVAGDDGESFLRQLDTRRVVHQSERVCPKCASPVGPEDIDCPECGVNIETGVMSEEQRRIRERIGPDPALFYSKVWSNSWNFLTNNKMLCVRTALYWTIFVYNAIGFATSTVKAWNREGVSDFGRYVETGIWGGVTFLFIFGIVGWHWYLTTKVTQALLERKKKVKDLHFDLHQCMALGVKAVIWPLVLMTPILWAVLPFAIFLYFMSMFVLGISLTWPIILGILGVFTFPYLAYPVAISHMSMPYTYKAWLPNEMIILFFKNIGATLYWWLVAFILFLPFMIYGLILDFFFGADLGNLLANGIEAAQKTPPEESFLVTISNWFAGLIVNNPQPSDWSFLTFWWIFALMIGGFVIATFTIPMSIPAVFLTRASANFTYYRYQHLDLVTHTKPMVLAGFWVRYLAFLVDQLIIVIMFGIFWLIFAVFFFLFVKLFDMPAMVFPLMGLTSLLCLFAHYRYYVRSEVGNSQGTLGKSSIGLIVTNMDGTKIKLKTARSRWFYRTFLTPETFYIGYLMVLFTKDKQTLHDSLTKTKVVWEGDRE